MSKTLVPAGPLVVLLLLILPIDAQAQVQSFDRFRAVDASGQRIEGEKGTWDGDVLRGTTRDGLPVEVAREDLALLDVRAGSHAGKYAAIGGGIGAAITVGAVANVASDPDSEVDTGKALAIGLGVTALGASIGALAGLQQSRWTNLELTPEVSSHGAPWRLAFHFRF